MIKNTRLLILPTVPALLKEGAYDLVSGNQVAGSFPMASAFGAPYIYVDVQQGYLSPPETKGN